MKSVPLSLQVFGIYMILIPGIGLMIAPELLLDLFRFTYGEHLWMSRMIGLLAFIIGVFDYTIAKQRLTSLYQLTVWLRCFATLFMIGLWATEQVESMILLFAAIDFLGASWTFYAIKSMKLN